MPAGQINPPTTSERRSDTRYRIIVRIGLLEQAGRASFCLVKNISKSGAQVEVRSASFEQDIVRLRVADEEPIDGEMVWIRDGLAGISFREGLEDPALLRLQQKLSPSRRRSVPRIRAAACAALRVDGRTFPIVVCDISSFGAKVRLERPLPPSQSADLILPDLPEVAGQVQWTSANEAGLAFNAPIPLQAITSWIDGRAPVRP